LELTSLRTCPLREQRRQQPSKHRPFKKQSKSIEFNCFHDEFCLEQTYRQNKVEKKDENSEINDGSHG
jgi:hypothetical protein